MIDIHSHILHGLDDGPQAFEVSVNMARMARDTGTTDIVATPHANASYKYQPELIAERIVELQNAVGDGIKIHRGCDFHLSPQNLQAASREPYRYAVNGLRYLLVEFPEMALFQEIERVFGSLMAVGLTPIVTHPERNRHLAADISRLQRWVGRGIPLQITAQSLAGDFGPDVARLCMHLLEQGLVHFVASDAHDLINRPPRLDGARDTLVDQFGEEYADLLLEVHPRAVIEGRPFDIDAIPPSLKKRKRWFALGLSARA